jgi:hypothetical protein
MKTFQELTQEKKREMMSNFIKEKHFSPNDKKYLKQSIQGFYKYWAMWELRKIMWKKLFDNPKKYRFIIFN